MHSSFSFERPKEKETKRKPALRCFHLKTSFYTEVHYPILLSAIFYYQPPYNPSLILLKNEEDSYRHL